MLRQSGAGKGAPAYDDAGNMIVGPAPGDEETGQRYVYDAWNRLVQVTDDEDVIIATYRYDGLGRRIQKLLGPDPEDPTATYDYFYDESWQVVEVRLDGAPDPLDQYVWDVQYIDAPVVRFHDGNTDGDLDGGSQEGDNTLYYTTDANWNVTALVDAETGKVVERYMYDPYGKVTVLNGESGYDADGQVTEWSVDTGGSDWANEILYCGYRFDAETGLYNVRCRYYHPTLGRWIERDPGLDEFRSTMYVSQYSDGMGLYQYVRSGPANRVDPSGLWGEDVHRQLTQKLAKEVGFDEKCAARIGDWTNAPDTDFWSRPGKLGMADVAMLAGFAVVPTVGPALAGLLVKKKWDSMAEWHFPVSANGLVEKDSEAAKKKLNEGLAKCDLEAFSRGLHVYQDSWSHEGKPFIEGIGHYHGVWPAIGISGEVAISGMGIRGSLGVRIGPEVDVSGSPLAALTGSADEPNRYKTAFFNEMRDKSREKLKKFFQDCPCACPKNEPPRRSIGDYTRLGPYANPFDFDPRL